MKHDNPCGESIDAVLWSKPQETFVDDVRDSVEMCGYRGTHREWHGFGVQLKRANGTVRRFFFPVAMMPVDPKTIRRMEKALDILRIHNGFLGLSTLEMAWCASFAPDVRTS